MRRILAGLFVLMVVVMILTGGRDIIDTIKGFLFIAVILAVWFYVIRPLRTDRRETHEEFMLRSRAAEELIEATYYASRAVLVHEFEDEGPHYFLGLLDDRTLYVTGQVLYDFEPGDESGLRRFPCSEVTISRHKTEGFIAEIACRGNVIEPEAEFELREDRIEAFADFVNGDDVINRGIDAVIQDIRQFATRR